MIVSILICVLIALKNIQRCYVLVGKKRRRKTMAENKMELDKLVQKYLKSKPLLGKTSR